MLQGVVMATARSGTAPAEAAPAGTTRGAVASMMAAQVPKAGGEFQIVEREVPHPAAGQVRIKVQACGVCHSDVFTKEGQWPGIQYPRVPGHEVVGIIDELGT